MCTSTIWTICKSVVADELAREFDELLQPRRLSLDDPLERIAAGCGAFIMRPCTIRPGPRSSRAAPPQCRASPGCT